MGLFDFLFSKTAVDNNQKMRLQFEKLYRSKDYEKAIEISKLIDIGDDDVLAYFIGDCFFNTGNLETTQKYFKMCLAIRLRKKVSVDSILWNLAQVSFSLNDFENVIRSVQMLDGESLKITDKYQEYKASLILGSSFMNIGLYQQAIDTFKGAKLGSDYLEENQKLMIRFTAECFENLGNKKQAKTFYEKFLKHHYSDEIIEKIRILS